MIDKKALAIHCLPGLSCDARLRIHDQLDDHRDLMHISWPELFQMGNVRKRARGYSAGDVYRRDTLLARMEELYEELSREGLKACSYLDPEYPPMLREIYDPPFMLFHTGTMPPPDIPAIGIVGTRRPTAIGEREGFRVALEAGYAGLPVISGLARGIDSAAHHGALAAGSATWAVLGYGIRARMSRFTQGLLERMTAQGGGVISEYDPFEEARTWYFPQRNRIISGLSRSLIVVEAPEGSGALLTVDFALDQGRDVYVHRCGLQGQWSVGTKRLAESGAPVLSSLGDLLSDWGWSEERIPRTDFCRVTLSSKNGSNDRVEVRYQQTLFRRCEGTSRGNVDIDR